MVAPDDEAGAEEQRATMEEARQLHPELRPVAPQDRQPPRASSSSRMRSQIRPSIGERVA